MRVEMTEWPTPATVRPLPGATAHYAPGSGSIRTSQTGAR